MYFTNIGQNLNNINMYKLILSFLLSFNFLTAQNIESIFLDSSNEIPLLTFDKPADIEELLNQEVVKGQMFNFSSNSTRNLCAPHKTTNEFLFKKTCW